MRTRSSSNRIVESSTIPRRSNKKSSQQQVASTIVEIPVVTMADQQNFELKHGLLNLVSSKQFYGHDKEDPHAHIRWFNKITSTMSAINPTDQDYLNADAGGNFLDKMPRDCMHIIEIDLSDAVKDLLRQNKTPTPASVKAVEDSCVTCGGPHPYYNCTSTDGNAFKDNIQKYVSAAAVNYNQGNTIFRPQVATNYRANQLVHPVFISSK
nr:hypothetical protein [Tanacetum cinerariifolium]